MTPIPVPASPREAALRGMLLELYPGHLKSEDIRQKGKVLRGPDWRGFEVFVPSRGRTPIRDLTRDQMEKAIGYAEATITMERGFAALRQDAHRRKAVPSMTPALALAVLAVLRAVLLR